MVIILLLVIGLNIVIYAIRSEIKTFNNGFCKVCGQKLKHFDTDSQGGRGYTCPSMHYPVWISYHCVDKDRKE